MDECGTRVRNLPLIGAGLLLWASTVRDFDTLYVIMLLNAMVYMPTIGLNNAVSYELLRQKGLNAIKSFPPIRVWGTVGFIAAMWIVDLAGWTRSESQLYVSAGGGLLLGIYSFTLPKCPPAKTESNRSVASALALDAFVLFKRRQMLVFLIFAMLVGGRAADHQCFWRRLPGRLQGDLPRRVWR